MLEPAPFWSPPVAALLGRLRAGPEGLPAAEAQRRLRAERENLLDARERLVGLRLLLGQFKSPIVLILSFCAALSFGLGQRVDATIILGILLGSALLGFWQEHLASRSTRALLALVKTRAAVLRDGAFVEEPADEVVPGDVVRLSAGDSVPADARILEAKDLFVDEALLTGETFPVEKAAGDAPPEAPLSARTNAVFLGSHVVSGTARVVVARIGKGTEFGAISQRLRLRPPETDFERGVRRFGFFLAELTAALVVALFAINVFLGRAPLQSLMFSLALAVGLTPQLLPAIISVNLAHGARRLAAKKVIVKRLSAIENFGSMDVLCSDKTGTLTEGKVVLDRALDVEGQESREVLRQAWLNAALQTCFPNPIDVAIASRPGLTLSGCRKLDEIPYDFERKRLSVLVEEGGAPRLITKGAVPRVLEACAFALTATGEQVPLARVKADFLRRYEALCLAGFRSLAVAVKVLASSLATKADEREMTLVGLLAFEDPPRPEVAGLVRELDGLGIDLKVITGDSARVAGHLREVLGLPDLRILSGPELHRMSDAALIHAAGRTQVFAEVEPNQKERIVRALQKAGRVVVFIGDGINDAPALHAADVGISMEGATDVAKEAADIVLLDRGLHVVVEGVKEGRRTFANTLKYVFMATSANFGNMVSMAAVSLVLPFLPLLPKQILLTNVLTDFPEMAIASDRVDAAAVRRPQRWDLALIRRFMLTFGLLSSCFDLLTFALLANLGATPAEFRTGWFVESVISATLIVLVIRTRAPAYRSRPGRALAVSTALVVASVLVLPFLPLAGALGFAPLPAALAAPLFGVILAYVLSAELAKRAFFRRRPGASPARRPRAAATVAAAASSTGERSAAR